MGSVFHAAHLFAEVHQERYKREVSAEAFLVALGSLVFGRSSIVALFGLLGVAITLFGS